MRTLGLDILYDGGRVMRLFVQRCLILFCLLYIAPANAAWNYANGTGPSYNASACDGRGIEAAKSDALDNPQFLSFIQNNPDYVVRFTPGCYSGYGGVKRDTVTMAYTWAGSDDVLTFCEENPTHEICRKTPEDCFELGQVFNPNTGQCSLSCPNGELNGQCLENPDSDCGPQSSDYMGAIGPGGSPVCESQFNECQGGGGQFGIFNGNSVCISDDYGPPTLCGPGQISVFDSYGFTCAPIVGSENGNPQWEGGEPNEDTDGDGVPDRFNPNLVNSSEMLQIVGGNIFNQNNHIINQNNITNHNLTNINNSVNNLNQTINQQGEQANQNLEGIAGILGQISGNVSDIAANLAGSGTGDGTGDGEGDGGEDGEEEPPISWSGESIVLEAPDGLEQLTAVQGEYDTLIANIRSEFSSAFGSFSGSGGLENNDITIFGHSFNAGLSKFGADLSIFGSIIMFAASFIALGILMGARD